MIKNAATDIKKVLFEKAIAAVPDYQEFLTVDELNASSRRLAEEYPAVVKYEEAGQTRAGDPIPLLTIGDGHHSALLFGCPHPNEPIGAMMLEFLSWELAENDALREELDFTWHIIKVADPDSTRLNEGWFKGPFTPTNYARHYYRPPGEQQVEWTFPIKYKKLDFQSPMPETEALMRIIDRTKPLFLYSLHNAGFGGVYFYLSEAAAPMYDLLHSLPRDRDLPLNLGEPEMPYAKTFAPAIYWMPESEQIYDYYEEYSDKDPLTLMPVGTSSYDYSRRVADTFCMACEMPYFYDSRVADTSKTQVTRREALMENIAASYDRQEFLYDMWDRVEPLLSRDTPFSDFMRFMASFMRGNLEAKDNWVRSADGLDQHATVAQLFDNRELPAFYNLLTVGTFIRMVEAELAYRGHEEERTAEPSEPITDTDSESLRQLLELRSKLMAYFDEHSQATEESFDYKVIPIQKLVQVQFGSALYMMDFAQRKHSDS